MHSFHCAGLGTIVMALVSMGLASAARADDAQQPNLMQSPYPMLREDGSAYGAPPGIPRHMVSGHLTYAPLYKAAALVYEYEIPEFSAWAIGLRADYLYRFGVVRIGVGGRYTGCPSRRERALHELSIPFLFSAMATLEKGAEFGVLVGLGPGVSPFRTIGPDGAFKEEWLSLPMLHGEVLGVGTIPLPRGLDLSFRVGVSGAAGKVFRLSVPIEVGVQRRW